MDKIVLLLALMSVSCFHGTRSEYLLVKLDSQMNIVGHKATGNIPEVSVTTENSLKSTKLPITNAVKGTDAAKKRSSRALPSGCRNRASDWWCKENFDRCWRSDVSRNCRRTCDDQYYCACSSYEWTCPSYNSFEEEGPIDLQNQNRKCILRTWLNDRECDCKNCDDEEENLGVPCQGPPTWGFCEMLIRGFTFDPLSKSCKEFNSGGCSRTANGFVTKEECEEKCSEGTKLEGETCGPCFNPRANFTCGRCVEDLECVPHKNVDLIPDLPSRCRAPQKKCGNWEWQCSNGNCIDRSYKCDGDYGDCTDFSDETNDACLEDLDVQQRRSCSQENLLVGISRPSLLDAMQILKQSFEYKMFYEKLGRFYFCDHFAYQLYDQQATLYIKRNIFDRTSEDASRSNQLGEKKLPPSKFHIRKQK